MKITAPAGCYLSALDLTVDAGETIDAPDDIAVSLVEQGWKQTKTKTKGEPAPDLKPAEAADKKEN